MSLAGSIGPVYHSLDTLSRALFDSGDAIFDRPTVSSSSTEAPLDRRIQLNAPSPPSSDDDAGEDSSDSGGVLSSSSDKHE